MNFRLLILTVALLAFLMYSGAEAHFEDMEIGVRSRGLGTAYTAISDDATAIHWNPAGLTQLSLYSVNTSYRELFGNTGITNLTLDIAIPYKKLGTFGLSIQQIGHEWVKERAFIFSHGINLTNEFAFGYNLTAYNLDVDRFGTSTTYGVDLGFMVNVYRRWRLGSFIHNINQPVIESKMNDKYDLPQFASVGISYSPLSGIVTALDITKEKGKDTRLSMGQEFRILDPYLTIRAGVQTAPTRYSGGFTATVKGLNIDYAIVNHDKLSLTHNFGVGYQF